MRYIPLDRIPVRPLPHRQHALDPFERSHPDVGVALIDNRVLTGQPTTGPRRAVFSIVAGAHTHYLAADSLTEAQQWVVSLREAWLHCFAHTARHTSAAEGGGGSSSATAVGQRLIAENALLRESLKAQAEKRAADDNEYFRCVLLSCRMIVSLLAW